MTIPESICDNVEIGKRLEDARVLAGVKEAELAETLDLSTDTLWYYKRGAREWGARTLAAAAVLCGKTPNEIVLREQLHAIASPQLEEFDAIDRGHILRALNDIAFLNSLGSHVRPSEIFAGAIRDVAARYRAAQKRDSEAGVIPSGSVIEHDGSAKLITPPSPALEPQTKRDRTGEAPAKYGNRRKKK